jgi:hypothetical protein
LADILAIVSKAVFEKDARIGDELIAPNDVWPIDRYNSSNKVFSSLKTGGRIFLVTVRPDEKLWLLGVVDQPKFDGTAWIAPKKNTLPVTDITALRKTIKFESGKGMSQDKGTLGMSLQTPRTLLPADVAQILALVGGQALPAPPPPAPVAAPPRIIGGKYEVLRQVGVGGMGVVHEARHTGTGRHVALKEIVGDELEANPALVERFQREARATGAVDSQHIALVLDTGTDPSTNHPYLVMELLHGEDLSQMLARTGPLHEAVAVRIVAQACLGLMRAHEAGVVHRDIKPANLFLARRDAGEVVVKLLDFGIARVKEQLAASENRALTTTGLLLGSPLYMSPEQVQGAKSLDHRSDLWSLGVVLHEALAGKTPYHDLETVGALFVAICSKPARPLRESVPGASAAVEAIVRKALEIDPEQRYPSAEAMLADLKTALPDGFALDETILGAQRAPTSQERIALAATELEARPSTKG